MIDCLPVSLATLPFLTFVEMGNYSLFHCGSLHGLHPSYLVMALIPSRNFFGRNFPFTSVDLSWALSLLVDYPNLFSLMVMTSPTVSIMAILTMFFAFWKWFKDCEDHPDLDFLRTQSCIATKKFYNYFILTVLYPHHIVLFYSLMTTKLRFSSPPPPSFHLK